MPFGTQAQKTQHATKGAWRGEKENRINEMVGRGNIMYIHLNKTCLFCLCVFSLYGMVQYVHICLWVGYGHGFR